MHFRHLRHRVIYSLRHAKHFAVWIAKQAARLQTSSTSIQDMIAGGQSAQDIEAVVGLAPSANIFPSYTGAVTQGTTLTADPGTWYGATPITYAYQWQKNNVNIAGATTSTYVVQAGDVGATISVLVTATNAYGSDQASSPRAI